MLHLKSLKYKAKIRTPTAVLTYSAIVSGINSNPVARRDVICIRNRMAVIFSLQTLFYCIILNTKPIVSMATYLIKGDSFLSFLMNTDNIDKTKSLYRMSRPIDDMVISLNIFSPVMKDSLEYIVIAACSQYHK